MIPRTLLFSLATCALAQIPASARHDIDAGNQDWIDGMKSGDAKRIASSYAEDAVDCSPAGECVRGHAAIEREYRDRVQKTGRASAASVTSQGSVQQGDFVYEWGEGQASFADRTRVAGRFLTVWRNRGGKWQIIRNLKIPPDEKH